MHPSIAREILIARRTGEESAHHRDSSSTPATSPPATMRRGGFDCASAFEGVSVRGAAKAVSEGLREGLTTNINAAKQRPGLAAAAVTTSIALFWLSPALFLTLGGIFGAVGTIRIALGVRSAARKVVTGRCRDLSPELKGAGSEIGRQLMGRMTFGATQYTDMARNLGNWMDRLARKHRD